MVDRVIIGLNPNDPTNAGMWVSKPGVSATSASGSPSDAYGYQIEDFSELGTNFIIGLDNGWNADLMGSYYSQGAVKAGGVGNKNLIYTGHYGHNILRTRAFVTPPGAPWTGALSPDAFIGANYPIVEIRMRRIWGGGSGPGWDPTAPVDGHVDFRLFWMARGTASGDPVIDHISWDFGHSYISSVNGAIHPDPTSWRSVFPTEGEWKTLEFDMDAPVNGADTGWDELSAGTRITVLRFDVTAAAAPAGGGWNPLTDPMWEIEYIRVKKRGTPINIGPNANRIDDLLLDSDINHMGIVHQSGTVTIGTAKAYIDGTTSNHVAGHNIDNNATGYVSFPSLEYIPLVLFQRIDENIATTGVAYPGGDDEFSICTQHWEDHRYPTVDINTSEGSHKGFDIQTVATINSDAYTSDLVSENFYSQSAEGFSVSLAVGDLPWTGFIPAPSNRQGNSFPSMIQSFSEIRTFAYVRAKKDGFWLTCRNAIAQEGMEPALNLAPVLPEEGTENQGSAAFSNMASNNDNGAWGMFHPALTLYDGQKFSEGLQLKWDTRTTANSILLDKVGKDDSGNLYDQYKWWPSFSCSGLPFSGIISRPSNIAPTDKSAFTSSYIKDGTSVQAQYTVSGILGGYTGGFYPYRFQKNESVFSTDGISFSFGQQYNIKRLFSVGIFHPHGVVPRSTEAESYRNRNYTNEPEGGGIKNQTAYIGGAMNTKTGSAPSAVASYDASKPNPPKYKYWVLRVPVSIPEYTS